MGGRGASAEAERGLKAFLNEGVGEGRVYPIDIEKMRDMSMAQIEDKIKGLNHEEAYIFDENGNLVAGFKGDKGSVGIDPKVFESKGYSLTHNHPKGTAEFGGTLSFADVRNQLRGKLSQTRAVASGQGERHYILQATNKAKPQAFIKRIGKDYYKLQNQMKEAYKEEYKRTNGNKHNARQKMTGVLNAYWKKTAEKYGYNYVNRKKQIL